MVKLFTDKEKLVNSYPMTYITNPEKQIIYPASMKKNIQVANFNKQLTREQWTKQVIRGA